jgi:hypothetical protein
MKLLEPPSTHKPLELLQSQLAGVPNYFAELRVMRGKAIPWPQQEFMDVEAILAGLADPRMSRTRTSYYYLYSYARKQLERAAHAGREPEEIENVQQSIKKLKDFGYAAASTATWVKYDEEAWLKRMQTECPGFSDWVYKGAIHDYGSFYAQ